MSELEELQIEKISDYYNNHETLKYEDLINFLKETDLITIFDSKENQDYFWNITMRFTDGKEEVDKEACKNSIKYIFKINGNEGKSEIPSARNSEIFNMSFSNNLLLKAAEEHYNNRRASFDVVSELAGDKHDINRLCQQDKKKRLFECLTHMNITQYEEFRKVLSLIDIKQTSSVSIEEIKELLEKYRIMFFSQEEILTLLAYLTEDNFEFHENTDKLELNPRLVEETIRKLDNCLNIVNIGTNSLSGNNNRRKGSTNSENTDKPIEMCEEIIKMFGNTDSYLLILKEYCSQIYSIIRSEMMTTLEEQFVAKNDSAKALLESEIEAMVFKIKNIEFFANNWKKNLENYLVKMNFLRNATIKYEEKIANYENLNEQASMLGRELPINSNDLNKLIVEINEENNILTQLNEENTLKINTLSLAMIEKEKVICNLTERNEELELKYIDVMNQLEDYTKLYKETKYQYEILLADTFKKQEHPIIDEEDEKEEEYIQETETNCGNENNPTNSENNEESDLTFKTKVSRKIMRRLKSAIHINDSVKNLLHMNYDDVIKYTINVEKTLKELEINMKEKETFLEQTQKNEQNLKAKIEKLKEKNHKLREQNCLLHNNNQELKKANEYSEHFRPSQILNNLVNISFTGKKPGLDKSGLDKSHISENEISPIKRKKNNASMISIDKTKENDIQNQSIIINPVRLSTLENSFFMGRIKKLDKANDLTQNNIVFHGDENVAEADVENDGNKLSFGGFCDNINRESAIMNLEANVKKNEENEEKLMDISVFDFKQMENETSQQERKMENLTVVNSENLLIKTQIKKRFKNRKLRMQSENFEIRPGNISFTSERACETPQRQPSIKNTNSSFKQFSFKDQNSIDGRNSQNYQSERQQNSNTIINIHYDNSFKPIIQPVTIFEANEPEFGRNSEKENEGIPIEKEKQNNEVFIEESKAQCFASKIEKVNISSANESFEDISVIMTRESYINNYDFVALKSKNAEISRHIKDENMHEIFSFNIHFFENIDKKVKRTILITTSTIYILKSDSLEIGKKYKLSDLNKMTVSNKNPNLIAFHFVEGEDLLIEILKRTELLIFLRDTFIVNRKPLRVRFSENFQIKKNNEIFYIIINQLSKMFIAPNFENAQKLGYLEKYHKGIFGGSFKEKFVVLTDIGLIYFDDPNDKQPKMLIPIFGSDIYKVEDVKYKKRNCFEIKTVNQEVYAFSGKTEEESKSWLKEFNNFKKKYEAKLSSAGISSKKKK